MAMMLVEEVREEANEHNWRCALIVTALDLELQAVVAHIEPLASVKGRDGVIYECGIFHDLGQDWLVVVAECGAGTHPAQNTVTNAHIDFDPELQIFVGIGGSRKIDVPVGNVVAADHVYMPYSGKYGENGFSARPREIAPDPRLLEIARKVRRDKKWVARIRDPADGKLPPFDDYPVDFPPLGHIAPAVSTEAVLANKESDLAKFIAEHYSDACIVEMEGYGAIFAAGRERKPAIVVRGVSDMTEKKDPASDKVRQPIAGCHAAAFAFEVLVTWGQFYPKNAPPAVAATPDPMPAIGGAPLTATEPVRAGATFVLNLDAELAAVTPERLAEIEAMLREITGELGLTIEHIEKGSLRLVVSDPSGALGRLELSTLCEALERRFSLHLFGIAPKYAVEELGELSAELLRASHDLLSWPDTLPSGEQIERPELDQLLTLSSEHARSVTALIGDPGSGKSALLATLGKRLVAGGYPVLAIKADLLDTDVSSEAHLRERLDLSDRPSTILARLAAFRPAFLLIDQLDALAGYLDLRTGRLSALLNLVRRLGNIDNVHIVLSARKFEYEHDARLHAISAESLILQLPAWSKVLALLESKGIAAAGWPTDAQEVLRSPQALVTYLQLDERARSEPLGSYQAMLERLWNERVLRARNGAARSRLASSIADVMAEEESLWLARARFEGRADDVETLIAAGILTPNASGVSIGFAHQTVFDFALARAFAQEKGRLSSYVRERQASLFLRPKVWAALTYLRSADMAAYDEEIGVIWGTPGLRRHLRLLLIDFLGQQSAPTDHEAVLMAEALKNSDERAVAFRAVAGSSGWFARFASSFFAEAMSEGGQAADSVVPVLSKAWMSAPNVVEKLLRECWLPNPENDLRIWSVIAQASAWTETTLEIATAVLGRTPIAPLYIEHVVSTVGVDQPEIAMKLVKAALDRDLRAARALAADTAKKKEPTGVSDAEKIAWRIRNNPREPLKRLTETSNEWETLTALAERAPADFITILWPWFVELFESLRQYSREREDGLGYVLKYEADFRFEGEHSLGLPEPSLLGAARTATEKLAKENVGDFRAWAMAAGKIDVAPVQRLIAHTFTVNPAELAHDALAFLLADHRRFYLGSIEDHAGTTTRLISAVSDYWSEDEILNFERTVWAFHPSVPDDQQDPRGKRAWNRLVRRLKVNLLRSLPARRASERTQKRLREEERALPGERLGVTFSGAHWVGSIMSAADMARASDDDLINAFEQLPDSTMWSHPSDWGKGGNIQLAREFANFAKGDPARAFRIIERFKPEFGERAAGYALDAMSETADPGRLMSTIVELAARGFEKSEFRGSTAMAVERLINRGVRIDKQIIDLYRRWLFGIDDTATAVADSSRGEEALEIPTVKEAPRQGVAKDAEGGDAEVRSLLWGHGGISIVPTGNFQLLEALVRICLVCNEIKDLIQLLREALDRVHDIECWKHLLRQLIYLRPAVDIDTADRVALLRLIIDRFPALLGTHELAFLLGHVHWWAPDFVEETLTRWQRVRSRAARRGYGELVTLLALLHPDRDWPQRGLVEIEQDAHDYDARTGAVMTAVNLWSEHAQRTRATALLVRLLPNASEGEWAAVFDLFRIVDELTPDENTVLLLEAIADYMRAAPSLNSTFIVDRLETLLPHEAPLVARIAQGLVEKWREELGDIRTGTAVTAPQLVNIAVTLHRLGPTTREDGTRLFEQLLDIDAYTARGTLDEIDNRFRQEPAVRSPRLPRRARRLRRAAGARNDR
jgi:nucleoside phosphorylase